MNNTIKEQMMRSKLIANQEGIGTSKLDLVELKILHWLTFKRFNSLDAAIHKTKEDLEKMERRKVF